MFFNFLNFFSIIFGILYLRSGKIGYEQEKFFLSFLAYTNPFRLEMKAGWCLIFEFFCYLLRNAQARVVKKCFLTNLCRPVSTGNEARMMLLNFLNIFAIFWEILKLGSGKKGSKLEKNFHSFSACPDPFRLEMNPGWCFLIFWIFLLFYSEIYHSGQVKTVSNEKIFFTHFRPFPTQFCLKWSTMFFNYFKLFAIFWEFSSSGQEKTVPNQKKKKFHSFSACLDPFRLEMNPGWCF